MAQIDETEFLDFAADVLGVPRGTLTRESAYGALPEWDSVMHLRLVMEVEARYHVTFPLSLIPRLTTLSSFLTALSS